MKTLIDIRNMYKIYEMGSEKVHALDGLDISIHPHEFVAIIGPSGSGKSTLMNMIGCLDTPTSGEYFLEGIDIAKYSENELAHIRNAKSDLFFSSLIYSGGQQLWKTWRCRLSICGFLLMNGGSGRLKH